MSSIAGFFHPEFIFAKDDDSYQKTIHSMSDALKKRGPDRQEFYVFPHGRLNHNALLCGQIHPDIPCETQPVTKLFRENTITLLYDGFISNLPELREEMRSLRIRVNDLSQEELLLCAFLRFGADFVKKLSGAFAIAIYEAQKNQLFLFRDALGLRPLFYTISNHTLVFASELKGLLKYPGVEAAVDKNNLNEIFSLGPAHTPGNTAFHNIFELKPGHFLCYGKSRLYTERFHQFKIIPHTDSYEDTINHITELLDHSIKTSSSVNAPYASLLSGGLDSSVISAKLADLLPENKLRTFSFDFTGSTKYFQSNSFQPSLDAPYVRQMQEALKSEHTTLTCGNNELFDFLNVSVDAHDQPAMADVDSSLLYFCSKIAGDFPVIFTGECADELFCGYPWYHRPELYRTATFPWSADLSPRTMLLKEDLLNSLHAKEYIDTQYQAACDEIQVDAFHTPDELIHQKTFYLTVRYFMQTLVDRTDRAASFYSMDARVPFADLALAEYLFQVPYEMKTKDGEVKHLLRAFARNLIPEEIRIRKKSPFPKTYDPGYESFLIAALQQVMENDNSPLLSFVDKNKLQEFCYHPKDLGKPWFGQLMAGPQLMAYYLQINYWMEKYQVKIIP